MPYARRPKKRDAGDLPIAQFHLRKIAAAGRILTLASSPHVNRRSAWIAEARGADRIARACTWRSNNDRRLRSPSCPGIIEAVPVAEFANFDRARR